MDKVKVRCPIMKSIHVFACLALFCLASAIQAQDFQVLKLHGRWSKPPVGYFLGNTSSDKGLAISDQWILAGSDDASEQATKQGAVQVFNAATGAWVRKLLPPPPATEQERFGDSIAISGNLAVISSDRRIQTGRVYVYDLNTGKKLRDLIAPAPTLSFGECLAISGDRVLVSDTDVSSSRGAVYVFSLKTGAYVSMLQPSDTMAFHYFGEDMAVDGTQVAIGAPRGNGGNGCVYLYDVPSETLIKKIVSAAAVPDDSFGSTIALTRAKLVYSLNAAASTNGRGTLHSLDLITGAERTFQASDVQDGDYLGSRLSAHAGLAVATGSGKFYVFDLVGQGSAEVAVVDRGGFFARRQVVIHNGTVLSTDEGDDSAAEGSGAVYVHRTFTRPLPMVKIAGRGDFAPGVADANFGLTSDAFINSEGEVGFTAKLTGAGSNGGRDMGYWSSLGAGIEGEPANLLHLVMKSRNDILGSPVVSVGQPLFNNAFNALYLAKRSGINSQIIMKENVRLLESTPPTERLFQNALGTQELSYTGLVQSHLHDRAAYGITLKRGVNGVDATNDSGLVFVQPSVTTQLSPVLEVRREGTIANGTGFGGEFYGQIPGRSALYGEYLVYPAALSGESFFNQALFRKRYGQNEILIARKGELAPQATDQYSAFIGESTDDLGNTLWRAGMSASVSTNEALWTRDNGNAYSMVMRKGDAIPALNAARISRFISFWISNGQTLALVKLTGANVTPANDQALLLYNLPSSPSSISVLMREGEPASGCHPATIGTISRVEVETLHGQYLVLASLTGAPANANQCLFRGTTRKDAPTLNERYLRRPVSILRKGDLYTDRPSRIKSISLPTTNLSPAGAGCTGLSTAMQQTNGGVIPNNIVLTVEFENRARQIMKGIP
jgi:hypothetical protein